jgi:uncharacterized protein YkwD
VSAGFASPPAVGKTSTLQIVSRSTTQAITGVRLDFGEALGELAISACRTVSATSFPFSLDSTVKFAIPYRFLTPGPHTVKVTLLTGGCSGAGPSSTQSFDVLVGAGPVTALASSPFASASGTCAGANLVPSASNRKKLAAAVLCLYNQARAAAGLGPLKAHKKLAKAATAHTADMLAKKYYAHARPGGPTLAKRFRKAKYRGGGGENLGVGSGALGSPAAMMKAWLGSPPHRANIMNKKFKFIGFGIAAKAPVTLSGAAVTYTINFGTRK